MEEFGEYIAYLKNKFWPPLYNLIYSYGGIANPYKAYHHNTINTRKGYLKKSKLYITGKNNTVIIGDNALLINTKIIVEGNFNSINIGKSVYCKDGEIYIDDHNNRIEIGNNTSLCGKIHLACNEGTSIVIGKNCLLSSEIVFRTSDSHSLLDLAGARINPARNIQIGDHVWVGNKVTILKGVQIASDSIVATGAIVTKQFSHSNLLIGGFPASVIRQDVTWDMRRL